MNEDFWILFLFSLLLYGGLAVVGKLLTDWAEGWRKRK